jgi:hypothetical protein
LSGLLLVSSLLLVLSLVWAVYDEIYGQRPWKSIQKRFVQRYTDFLKKTKPKQAAAEKAVRQSEEYRKLEQEILEQERALAPQLKEIDREVTEVIGPRLTALTDPFALARSEIQAVTYRVEVASSQGTKDSLSREIEKLKARLVSLSLPAGNGQAEKASMNFVQLEQEFNRLWQRRPNWRAVGS